MKSGNVQQHHMSQAVYDAIQEFRAAFLRMNEVFNDDHYMTWLSDEYPFDYCFEDLTDGVVKWCDDMTKGVIVDR